MAGPTPDRGMLVIGDAMLDAVAVSDAPVPFEPAELDYVGATIDLHPGGTGVNLALSAVACGYSPVRLLCSLGAGTGAGGVDAAGALLLDALAPSGVGTLVNVAPGAGTGIVSVGYIGDGKRVMFGSPGANRAPLSPDAVAAALSALDTTGVLVVSGWMLFRPTTRAAVGRIMSEAAGRGIPVVLDVVPHALHRTVSAAEFDKATKGVVDHVAGNALTFARLFAIDVACAAPERVAGHLLGSFAGALVHGGGRYVAAHRTRGARGGPFPGPADQGRLRGMSDRLLVSEVRDHFLTGPPDPG
ncbi:carbohydrate kinase family protein [Streptomyces sp. NPDC058092]|uniref:carbohydrate kinase family protein n=1 Tax=Streptomyces sp. NPDC058092 TaxID=3346336 RepID=UPI0036E4C163